MEGNEGKYMKIMKKITTLLFAVCLAVPWVSFAAHAAEGTLMFSDPATAVGQEVTVDVKVRTGGGAIGDGKITVTYDAAALEFKSGTNATGSGGTVNLSGSGDGAASELSFSIVFKALKEGETAINVGNYTAFLYNNEKLNLSLGASKVTIGPGDGTTAPAPVAGNAVQVKINDKNYTIAENFADVDIPEGFTRSTLSYEGADRQVIMQESSGQYMFFLQDEAGKGEFFLYDGDTDVFAPFVKIDISENAYIMLLNKTGKAKLPSEYVETTLETENGEKFIAWQNAKNPDYYVVYALGSDGTKGYYQHDTKDGTYQRFNVPKSSKDTDAAKGGLLGKATNFVDKYMKQLLIGVWGIFLVFLIVILVLGVKLYHRNQELDEIYEEEDEDEDEVLSVRKKDAKFKRSNMDFEDEFEDEIDEDDEEYEEFEDLEEFDLHDESIAKTTPQRTSDSRPQRTGRPEVRQPASRAASQSDVKYQTRNTAKPEVRQEKPVKKDMQFPKYDDEDDFTVDFIDLDD